MTPCMHNKFENMKTKLYSYSYYYIFNFILFTIFYHFFSAESEKHSGKPAEAESSESGKQSGQPAEAESSGKQSGKPENGKP